MKDSFSQTEEDKSSMATAAGSPNTAEAPYFIEVEENGCSTCSAGRMWIVVGPDGAGGGTSYGDEEAAQEVADLMNEAYHVGKAQPTPSPNEGASSLADARTELVGNAGAAGQLSALRQRELLQAVLNCETHHDEKGHAYLKVPARSLNDLGALIAGALALALPQSEAEGKNV